MPDPVLKVGEAADDATENEVKVETDAEAVLGSDSDKLDDAGAEEEAPDDKLDSERIEERADDATEEAEPGAEVGAESGMDVRMLELAPDVRTLELAPMEVRRLELAPIEVRMLELAIEGWTPELAKDDALSTEKDVNKLELGAALSWLKLMEAELAEVGADALLRNVETGSEDGAGAAAKTEDASRSA